MRNKKRKKRKMIILITALLAFLFIAIVLVNKLSDRGENEKNEQNNPNDLETSIPPIKEKDTEKEINLVDINVTPDKYTLAAGETINIDDIIIRAVYDNGKTKEVTLNDVKYSTDSEIIDIDNNNIVISDAALTAQSGIVNVNYNGISKDLSINIFNELEDNLDENGIITNAGAYDVLVNKNRNLPKTYVPEDLVPLGDIPTVLQNPEINQLRKVAYEELKELFAAAKDEESYILYARSGYRSYSTQDALYKAFVSNNGQEAADKYSAKPGQSEHQTGLAMDITCEAMNYQLNDTFGDTEEGKWVAENAHRFGFIIRYQKGKEEITGYSYEPWHIRYVGKELAEEIYITGLTLEEYFLTMEEQ